MNNNTEKQINVYKQAVEFMSQFATVDQLAVVKAYVAGFEANPIDRRVTDAVDPQPYIAICCGEDNKPTGVRIIGLGENFVVALHDAKVGDKTEFTWEEACKLNAPTKKQAACMEAVWDELNDLLEKAGGDRLDDGCWRWTRTEYISDYAWLYYGDGGLLDYYNERISYTVRPVLA